MVASQHKKHDQILCLYSASASPLEGTQSIDRWTIGLRLGKVCVAARYARWACVCMRALTFVPSQTQQHRQFLACSLRRQNPSVQKLRIQQKHAIPSPTATKALYAVESVLWSHLWLSSAYSALAGLRGCCCGFRRGGQFDRIFRDLNRKPEAFLEGITWKRNKKKADLALIYMTYTRTTDSTYDT